MADTRRAVRELLRAQFPDALAALTRMPGCAGGTGYDVPADAPLVLVALSGGADSLALAAATAFEAQRCGLHAGAVIVDHQLQDGSAEVAAVAAAQATKLGLAPVIIERVTVAGRVDPQGRIETHGPEADARAARYGAFARVSEATGAQAILLAHTLNDQAETVLLGLARGAGATSIAAMTPVTGRFLRPFLGITREQTEQACADQSLEPWHDPHNTDRGYARVRIRHDVLPVLENELGPGIAESLARTAAHLQDDAEVLDALAKQAWCESWVEPADGFDTRSALLNHRLLAAHPRAIRTRVMRAAAERAELGMLTSTHIDAIDALMTNWHGQGALHVPGGTVARADDILIFSAE
jgi:tRNA(Ile)-lysidine synthase